MKIVQALEDSNFILKRIPKAIESELKSRLLGMLLGALGDSLLKKYVNRHRNINHWL